MTKPTITLEALGVEVHEKTLAYFLRGVMCIKFPDEKHAQKVNFCYDIAGNPIETLKGVAIALEICVGALMETRLYKKKRREKNKKRRK